MAFRVTFDTNVLADIVSQETSQRAANGTKVRAAIQAGHIQGFFSETLVTLEGIENKYRAEVLGKTRVVSERSLTGETRITLAVGVGHVRNRFEPRFIARVQAALALGMRALMAPARTGAFHTDENCPLFEPTGGMLEFLRWMDKVNGLATAIEARGVGRVIAVSLGRQFSERDGVSEPELWLQGLGRARNKSECKKVAKATSEWADGDSVAAHYGFGIDQFCSEDFGKSTSGRSVLDCNNRKWLREEFGIQFVTLAELAKMVTAPIR